MTKAFFSGRAARAAAIVIVAALALAPAVARAAGKRKIGVDISGSSASHVRSAVDDVLRRHGFEVSPVSLPGDSGDAIASAAKQGKLAAVVVGEVRDGGKRAKLRVYGAGGDLVGEGSWAEHGGVKKLAAAIERTLWARVGGALSKSGSKSGEGGAAETGGKAPAEKAAAPEKEEAEEAPAEEKPTYSRSEEAEKSSEPAEGERKPKKKKKEAEEAPAEEEEAGAAPALTALDFGVGPRFISRTLSWPNNLVRGYDMGGYAPAVGLSLAWFPAAHVRGGWPSNIGLAVSAEYLPGYDSKTSDGTKYPTAENDYFAGVRGRMPLGPVEAALTLGGGQHGFVFKSGTMNRGTISDLPDTIYTYARAGIDLRIALPAKLSALVGGGYRYVLNGGKDNFLVQGPMFFPGAKFMGFDATGGLAYRVLSFLEARAGVDFRRYQITTHASGGQPAVASGSDQTIGIWVQAAVVIDGVSGGATGRPAPPPAEDTGKDAKKDQKSGAKAQDDDEDKGDEKPE